MSVHEVCGGFGSEEKERQAAPLIEAFYVALPEIFDDPNLHKEEVIIGILQDDSPYPEVRSTVPNTDDPSIPCGTFRAWVMGIIWAIVVPGLNQFLDFRYPSVTISNIVAQLLSFPMGRLWARIVPNCKIFGISINPSPFSVKEHVLVTLMATIGCSPAYSTGTIAAQRVYYNQVFTFGYQWMLIMSTQMIGFSLGGVMRRFLVEPPSMIWPMDLVNCALFNTLHAQVYNGMGTRGGLSRGRFFTYVWFGSLCWYFFPGYLFQALSYFTWVCWIAPDNVVVNQLFGYQSGLGMSLITFDWAQITYISSPFASPWWAVANITSSFIIFFWIVAPIIHFTNTWYGAYMPMQSRIAYDNTGATYNVTRILTPNNQLNLTAYQEYSPLFLSTTFALNYGLNFASITSTIVHTILFYRRQIQAQVHQSLHEQPDIHARLMSKYSRVPEWWYMCIFVVMFAFGVVCIEVWPTDLPVWAFILALLISFVYIIPIGIIQATSNHQTALNVISELIAGYTLPGRPLAMMLFKAVGYNTVGQALQFASDLKLGHYMKIPPRTMFWCQVVGTVISGTVQLGVQSWMFTNIHDMCSPTQSSGFICPNTEVFGTASIIWGVIGPQRQLSSGQIYYKLLWFFLLGALCPAVAWFAQKRWPNSWVHYINFPVMFASAAAIPPASAVNYVTWGIVGFIFQYIIRRRHFSWWSKYNYVLSAALDSGLACSIILIFFCLKFPENGAIGANNVQTWWGNTVFLKTADGLFTPLQTVNGTFG